MAADPKPAKRIKNPAAVHAVVLANPVCQVCGFRGRVFTLGPKTFVAGVSGHHIVSKAQRGDDVPENILVVCGHGTAGCHGLLEARDFGTQKLARASMSVAQEEYAVRKKGWVWLEHTYPRSERQRPIASRIAPRDPAWYAIDRTGWPPAGAEGMKEQR